MMKHEVLQRIVDSGVVAVVRADTLEQAARIAEACAEGGVAAVELSRLLTGDRVLIGAGTVLDPETARTAVLSDAQFAVSPGLNADRARRAIATGFRTCPAQVRRGSSLAGSPKRAVPQGR
jgi:2-dehydro-3-deoxyphosphogluconate aldolase/(4S)-4-hydroxy-2-oxoglutarate aldolase